MEKTTRYTPQSISDSTEIFNIPLYQRLFEWGKPQIEQLMSDLLDGFLIKPNEPYYIGMLTAHKNDLVDGQQRFTVLMLMAIAFEWTDFFKSRDNSIRLKFFARKKDDTYLLMKIKHLEVLDYINVKMENGINTILDFMKKEDTKEKLKRKEKNENEFKAFIFNNLTFFISELPDSYVAQDLNKYFEAMNAAGKGLENYEILKVDLLKKLPVNSNKTFYTRIWNLVSDMDKKLIRIKSDEKSEQFTKRQIDVIRSDIFGKGIININILESVLDSYCNNNPNSLTDINYVSERVLDIKPTTKPPSESYRSIGERAILNFPEFLLQGLWLQLSEEERNKTSNFFNVHKLQETFKEYLHIEKVELFFQNLLKYRLLFDYFIIRISNKENNTTTYTLALKEDENDITFERQKLIQYQSMLYVSTTSYIWLTEILQKITEKPTEITPESMFNSIVEFDNARLCKHGSKIEKDSEFLNYGKIDRYWFWRLDYYLWENRKELFKGNEEQLKVVEKYAFKQNRSIEHLHPQTSSEQWDNIDLHSFGNLAMISPEFNSSQSNDDIKLKFARVETQIEGRNNLESIKLLLMYNAGEGKRWSKDLANEHGKKMIDILNESFKKKQLIENNFE